MPPSEEQSGNNIRVLFSKQMYFSKNNDNATALTYSDISSNAVQWFQKVNNCLKMHMQG
jgi:hypothetical protein